MIDRIGTPAGRSRRDLTLLLGSRSFPSDASNALFRDRGCSVRRGRDAVALTRSLRPVPGDPIRIKGTSVLDTIEATRQREGEQRLAQIVASLAPPLRQVFENRIVPTSYYSLDAFCAFLEAGLRLGNVDERILITRTEAVAEQQLTGLYRAFVKSGSPAFVVQRITTIHQTFFTGIGITVELETGHARIRYSGFRQRHRLIEYVMIGFYQKAIQICGGREVRAEMSIPMADDAEYCELHVAWQ